MNMASNLHTEFKGFFETLRGVLRRVGVNVPKLVELKVHLAKDEESGRWFIAASDIPGLRVEADSADELIRIVQDVAPDLIELNAAEIIANDHAKSRRRKSTQKPTLAIRPVFDTPMAIAC